MRAHAVFGILSEREVIIFFFLNTVYFSARVYESEENLRASKHGVIKITPYKK